MIIKKGETQMQPLKIILIGLMVWAGLTFACYGYDIVQVTNTPDADESGYSVAIFGNIVYAIWNDGMRNIYFDKSLDLGKTWNRCRKVIGINGTSSKIMVSNSGVIFVAYYYSYGREGYMILMRSTDRGENFVELRLPQEMENSCMYFTINKSGNIIYGGGYSTLLNKWIITKSFDGGATFSAPKDLPTSASLETLEISNDGKYVYVFYIGIIYIEGYRKTVPFLVRSIDYGETFEEPRPIFVGHHWSYELNSAISENGEIYVAWIHDSYGEFNVRCLRSIDNGVNFICTTINDCRYPHTNAYRPSIVVDIKGNVYATFIKDGWGICYDKIEKVNPDGSIQFGEDKKIDEMGLSPIIAVTSEGDQACIMWGCASDLYCTTFPTNQPPVLTPIGNREVNEGSLLDFTISATDPDGDALTYSTSNLPSGATFDTQTGRFTWMPNYNQAGSYEGIKFTVSDGSLTDDEAITITVNNTNRSPFFAASVGNKSVNEGSALPITVQATDPDGDVITYSMINAPQGAAINPQRGQFNWTPNYSQGGSYIVTFVASDGSLSAGDTITITVNNVPQPPQVGDINPSAGSSVVNLPVAFTTTYTDSDGWQDIKEAYLLINSSATGKYCFYGYYDQNTNKLYLRNNSNSSWMGGYAPGVAKVITNSYATLDCSKTTVLGDGNTLTVNWKVTFKSTFLGAKNSYLKVKDDSNAMTNWVQKGTWTIMRNYSPSVGTVTPPSGSSIANTPVNFTTTYSDANGWQDIYYGLFLINTAVSGSRCFYGYYDQNANKLYLRNDANTAWLGGFTPQSPNTIQNSYATLDCSKTTVTGQGNTMTITWNITFKPTFKGAKNMYLYVKDDSSAANGWVKKGTWTIK